MTKIGDIFQTGEKVPVSGSYSYERHVESMTPFTCAPTHEEEHIELSKGDTFPAHKECNQDVIWKLEKES
jgi:hypothetical protein